MPAAACRQVGRAGGDGVAAVQVEVRVREAVAPGARAVVAGRVDRVRAGGEAFFFNDPATTEIYALSLHDALPIYPAGGVGRRSLDRSTGGPTGGVVIAVVGREA